MRQRGEPYIPKTYEGLLLPNHDWGFEMQVDNNEQFVVTRLEKEVLDVSEQNI
jgi:hypothetical protein